MPCGISGGADCHISAPAGERGFARRQASRLLAALPAAMLLLLPALAQAATGEAGAPHLDGAQLSLPWGIPFVGMLLSIAIFPLLAPLFWHRNFGRVSAFWGLAFLVPFTLRFGWELSLYEMLHVGLLEYLPFIILLFSLFTVAGGVRLTGSLVGRPVVNVGFLGFGTLLASWMGTTGAAMLLIRPLLRANAWRRTQMHVVIFFIFLVANIGGSLTPLGDPPLFLGFLKGVDFFWPTTHLLLPMLFCTTLLLLVFYAIDSFFYRREDPAHAEAAASAAADEETKEKLGLEGGVNILLLGGIVGAVLMSGIWEPGISFEIFHVEVELQNLTRDLLLLGLSGLSLLLTSKVNREKNGFSWFPIVEVAKLFAGIFMTIIPAIAMLRAGESGALSAIIDSVSRDGQPINAMYFWSTGILSSFLDNAPTYLVFFNTAGGEPAVGKLMTDWSGTLLAISAGAVFMGAMTYIGNAPNFMVRSIAEDRGIKMPSFFGYMAWSCIFLLPIFGFVTVIWFI